MLSRVRDLFLHVEAVLDKVPMVLLKLQQHVALLPPVLLGRRGNATVVFVHHLHVLLVKS